MKYLVKIKLALIILAIAVFLIVKFNNTQAEPPTVSKLDVQLPDPVISSVIPDTVAFGEGITGPETARPFFDYFSWQSFVALNWQAAAGSDEKPVRGEPDKSASINSDGKRVWESYKADWELFRPDGSAPTAWSSYELNNPTSTNPCGNSTDSKMLVMVTKMDSIVDGINQARSGPLVDQNRNYVRYEIHVNKPYYDKVIEKKWYLFAQQSKDPKKPNVFPDGVIEIKAAWKELVAGKDDPSRFYTVNALIVEPGPNRSCRPAQMGLIGFHIANKVAGFREWVWSTFEQVDNVPEGSPVSGQRYSLNNGTTMPATPKGFDRMPGKLPDNQTLPLIEDIQRNPVQVTRITPVSPASQAAPTTEQINAQWQQALSGTVWRFYKLVITQWPTVMNGENFDVEGSYPEGSDKPFPNANVANTTMETYLQKSSCIRCHYTASQDDFSFLLELRAFKKQPVLSKNLTLMQRAVRIDADRIKQSPTLRKLDELLKKEMP